jgi:DNA polymerase-3 subunit delta'
MPYKPDHALNLLKRAQDLGRLGHAYLITGPREARLEDFAAQVLSLVSEARHPVLDDWAQQGAILLRPQMKSRRIGVGENPDEAGTMRYLEKMLHRTTQPGQYKMAVIVDAERMTIQAQNAFLKTLEEPPARTLLLLLSTHPEQLLPTILSRVIEMPLMPPAGQRTFDEQEQKLLAVLSQTAERSSAGIGTAMALKARFQEVLASVKEEIEEEIEDEFEKEKEHYAQTTDGAWLKRREEEVTARIQAAYLHRRDALMDLLLSWMGDVARQQVGSPHLDLPESQAHTAKLAERWTPESVMSRMRALRKLEQLLHTNVNEGLALDVAFIQAFGR